MQTFPVAILAQEVKIARRQIKFQTKVQIQVQIVWWAEVALCTGTYGHLRRASTYNGGT